MRFTGVPNLPQGRVTLMAINGRVEPGLKRTLMSYGIELVENLRCDLLSEPVCTHPDMQMHHLGGAQIIVHNYNGYNDTVIDKLKKYGFDVTESISVLGKEYPADVAYNSLRIGNNLFCKKENTATEIRDYCTQNGIRVIDIQQGYAKCSVCVVAERAMITSDSGIAIAAQRVGIDVLKIREGYIRMPGYHYGFIGGASFKLDKSTVCFTGNIKNHPDYDALCAFMRNYGVYPLSLTDGMLVDYGSFIPLMENEE